MKLNWLDVAALVLAIVGGLNWGLVGLFDFDLVAQLFGSIPVIKNVILSLIHI